MRLYICDFDDTLIDNFPMDYESFRSVAESAGYRMITKEKLREMRIRGLLAEEIMKSIAPEKADILFRKRKALVMDSCFLECAKVRPHVHQALAKIKEAGHVLCIATRRMNRKKINEFLQKEGLIQYVATMLCGDDVKGTPEEVKQEMYQQLMRKYNMKAEDTLVIGNTETDLSPARQLHIKTAAFDGTYTKKEEIEADMYADFKMLGDMIV